MSIITIFPADIAEMTVSQLAALPTVQKAGKRAVIPC